MYTSLAATSETLRSLIEAYILADVGPSSLASLTSGANTGVSLATPQEMSANSAPVRLGVSLWLYRLLRDKNCLNDVPTLRPLPSGKVEVVPPPLRLHYLVTPLARTGPDTEHRMRQASFCIDRREDD